MASCSKKNNNDSLLFVHFLLPIRALHDNLELPRKFVKSYGHHLPSRVTLKVPTSAKWPVEILRRNGKIWLQKGWQEFAKRYSLAEGSFLSFGYEKSSGAAAAFDQFNVIIFDNSMMEIDYVDDADSSDSSIEILPSKEQFKKRKTTCAKEQRVNQSSFRTKKSPTKTDRAEAVYVQSEERIRINKSTLTSSTNKLTKEEKIKAVERANSNFHSDENPFFEIVMQPSYVRTSKVQMPAIPSKFAKKYNLEDRIGDPAKLKVLDGRSWPIELYITPNSAYREIRIKNSGWKKFVQDNHLQVVDVCIFELLLEYVDVTVFRVVVSRYSDLSALPGNCKKSKEKASCSKAPKTSSDHPKRRRVESSCDAINENHTKKKMKVLNRDSTSGSRAKSNSGNPTFYVPMKASHFLDRNIYYLRLPWKIVKNMEQGNREVKLQVGNKYWTVTQACLAKDGLSF